MVARQGCICDIYLQLYNIRVIIYIELHAIALYCCTDYTKVRFLTQEGLFKRRLADPFYPLMN